MSRRRGVLGDLERLDLGGRSILLTFEYGWTLSILVGLTKPSSSEYRTRASYSTVGDLRDTSISTPFYTPIRVIGVLPLLRKRRGRRSTLARRCMVSASHDSSAQG